MFLFVVNFDAFVLKFTLHRYEIPKSCAFRLSDKKPMGQVSRILVYILYTKFSVGLLSCRRG